MEGEGYQNFQNMQYSLDSGSWYAPTPVMETPFMQPQTYENYQGTFDPSNAFDGFSSFNTGIGGGFYQGGAPLLASNNLSMEQFSGANSIPVMEQFSGVDNIPMMEQFSGADNIPMMEQFSGADNIPVMEQFSGVDNIPVMEQFSGGVNSIQVMDQFPNVVDHSIPVMDQFSGVNNIPVMEQFSGGVNSIQVMDQFPNVVDHSIPVMEQFPGGGNINPVGGGHNSSWAQVTAYPGQPNQVLNNNVISPPNKILQGGSSSKRQWTKEEDSKLHALVTQFGSKDWVQIASRMEGRARKQCRKRWFNHVHPGIKKDDWGESEEKILVEAHQKMGNKWADIARMIPGRTENAIKNHWNATKRKKTLRCRRSKRSESRNGEPRPTVLLEYIRGIGSTSASPPTNTTNVSPPTITSDTDVTQGKSTDIQQDDLFTDLENLFPDTPPNSYSTESPSLDMIIPTHDEESTFMKNLFGDNTTTTVEQPKITTPNETIVQPQEPISYPNMNTLGGFNGNSENGYITTSNETLVQPHQEPISYPNMNTLGGFNGNSENGYITTSNETLVQPHQEPISFPNMNTLGGFNGNSENGYITTSNETLVQPHQEPISFPNMNTLGGFNGNSENGYITTSNETLVQPHQEPISFPNMNTLGGFNGNSENGYSPSSVPIDGIANMYLSDNSPMDMSTTQFSPDPYLSDPMDFTTMFSNSTDHYYDYGGMNFDTPFNAQGDIGSPDSSIFPIF